MSGTALTVRQLLDELEAGIADGTISGSAPITIAVRRSEDVTDPAMYVTYDAEALPAEWGNQSGQLLLQAAPDVRIGVPAFGEPRE